MQEAGGDLKPLNQFYLIWCGNTTSDDLKKEIEIWETSMSATNYIHRIASQM